MITNKVIRIFPRRTKATPDDNLLACSPEHIEPIFNMLSRQKEHPQIYEL